MIRTSFVFVAVLLAGCSEQGFSHVKGIDDGFGPDIEVSPERLEYGTLSTGDLEVKEFKVTNVGTSALHISHIEISGAASFVLLTAETNITLSPDAYNTFEVAFSPLEANENYGSVVILSDDVDESTKIVELVGGGAVPELEINPDPYDFGVDYVGCGYGHEFTLSNIGTEDLIIDSVAYDNSDDQLSMDAFTEVLPLNLAPGDGTSVWVDFLPASEEPTSASIVVESNDPRGTVTSEHTGEGVFAGWHIDKFEVPENPPVDIIFAVDRSCSMDDDAASLAANFSSFITQIDSVTTEWKIGVVTADNGCFNTVIDNTTANYDSLFSTAVLSNNWNMYTEALLTLVKQSLSASSSCNAGFLREGSIVHGIMVSDEPEQSPGSWSTLVTTMESLVGDPSRLKLSAIAGDYPSGCGSADPGTGYYEAVMATGGEFLSICSNWSKNVDVLAAASTAGLLNFELSSTPAPTSIIVTVNGAQWLADWHYDSGSNSVILDIGVDDGSNIVIEYGALTDCD